MWIIPATLFWGNIFVIAWLSGRWLGIATVVGGVGIAAFMIYNSLKEHLSDQRTYSSARRDISDSTVESFVAGAVVASAISSSDSDSDSDNGDFE